MQVEYPSATADWLGRNALYRTAHNDQFLPVRLSVNEYHELMLGVRSGNGFMARRCQFRASLTADQWSNDSCHPAAAGGEWTQARYWITSNDFRQRLLILHWSNMAARNAMTDELSSSSTSPEQPDPIQEKISSITTGGVDLDANQVSVGADIVGRDKIVNNAIHISVHTTSDPQSADNAHVTHQALIMARRALSILEEQAAAFGKLHIPAHLQIELEEKRVEVAELESRTQFQ